MLEKNHENGKRIYRWRKQTIERSFAEAKELHGLRYARMLGLAGMYEQSFLTPAVQNMKRIAKAFRPLLASFFLFLIMLKGHDLARKSCPLSMVWPPLKEGGFSYISDKLSMSKTLIQLIVATVILYSMHEVF